MANHLNDRVIWYELSLFHSLSLCQVAAWPAAMPAELNAKRSLED